DMSFFLEMFQYAAEEFIRRNRRSPVSPWPLISPICPVVVRLIAFQFPSLLPHVLPVLRPVALMAREVQKQILPALRDSGPAGRPLLHQPLPDQGRARSRSAGAPPERRRPPSGSTTCTPS
ncbi:MAG: hypothetical protein MZV70_18685, partial [Desulfobacterales bacterium]|nr:hypothetical protein [Desulfobacterales bacterium]